MGAPHNGRNLGTIPVRILAVYLGAEGQANAEAANEGPRRTKNAQQPR